MADLDDIKNANKEVMQAFDAFRKTNDERIDGIEAALNRPRPGGGGGPGDGGGADANMRKALGALGTMVRTGNEARLNELSVASDPDGGYLTVPVLSTSMTKRLFDGSPMRRLARTETISDGDSFEEPIDDGDVEAVWVGERQARPPTTGPTIRMRKVPVHEMYALQPVTQRLLDDARFDIGSWMERKIGDRFARSEGAACFAGDGVIKPRGILSYETDTAIDGVRDWGMLQHVVSGHATKVTADGLRDLYWAMRAPHRAEASWIMASSTANAIDKLKDGNGDYLWRNGMTAGAPPSLLGRPVEFSEDMPAIEAGATPITFGDWKQGYILVDKLGIRYLRDPFTSKPNVLFYAYRRTGGAVANSDAVKMLKIAAS
jgi:HK97 family phage major capsid protein